MLWENNSSVLLFQRGEFFPSSQCVLFNSPHHISQGSWSLREFDGQDSHVECLDSTQWWDNILSINCIYFLLFWCYCCSKSKIFMFGEDFSLPPLQTWWSPLLCFLSSGCENPRLWNSSRPPGTAQQPTPVTLLITLLITPYSNIFFRKTFFFFQFPNFPKNAFKHKQIVRWMNLSIFGNPQIGNLGWCLSSSEGGPQVSFLKILKCKIWNTKYQVFLGNKLKM